MVDRLMTSLPKWTREVPGGCPYTARTSRFGPLTPACPRPVGATVTPRERALPAAGQATAGPTGGGHGTREVADPLFEGGRPPRPRRGAARRKLRTAGR